MHNSHYLVVQRQFEDDDGSVCYIETHDHDTYTGHFPLRLRKFTPTCLAFEITRAAHNYVEVTYELDAKRLDDVQRIVHIIFGLPTPVRRNLPVAEHRSFVAANVSERGVSGRSAAGRSI